MSVHGDVTRLSSPAAPAGATAGLAAVATALGAAVLFATFAPAALVLPGVSLVTCVLAFVAGAVALASGRRDGLLLYAGLCAFMAMAAAMIGDPDHVARLFN